MKTWDPKSWTRQLAMTGDIAKARADIERSSGFSRKNRFLAEGMLGRLSSLLLNFTEADAHFERAAAMACDLEGTDAEIRYALILETYAFENRILMGKVPTDALRQSPVELLHEMDWRLTRALALSIAVRAIAHLHEGHDADAFALFGEAARRHSAPRCSSELIGLWQIGQACCEQNLGDTASALRRLDSVELHYRFAGRKDKINSTALAAALYAILERLGHSHRAESWRATVAASGLPHATTNAFMKRASLMISRCASSKRLVLL